MTQDFLFNNSKTIAKQYSAMETEIFQMLHKNLKIHSKNIDSKRWIVLAMNNKKQFKQEISMLVKKYNKQLKPVLIDNILKTIDDTIKLADSNIGAIQKINKFWNPPRLASDRIKFINNLSPQVKKSLVLMSKDIKIMNSAILNNMNSWYARSVQNIAAETQSGQKTFNQAITNTMNKWIEKGIPAIKTKNGRNLNPRSYVEIVTRATMKKDYIDNTVKRYGEFGCTLVVSQVLGDSSQVCEDDQGVIFDESGKSNIHRPLSGASDGFLTHINCRHTLTPYFDGISIKPPKISQKTIDKNRNLRLRSRNNERQIRKYKLRSVADPSAKNHHLVRRWEQKQTNLYKYNPQMRRDYFREKIFSLHKNNTMSVNTPIKTNIV